MSWEKKSKEDTNQKVDEIRSLMVEMQKQIGTLVGAININPPREIVIGNGGGCHQYPCCLVPVALSIES